MKGWMKYGFCRWVRTSRFHVIMGVTIFVVASYFMIANTYPNLTARQQTESLLNAIGLFALAYATVAWCLHFFLHPKLPPACTR
jgi:ABC-type transport system involved in cytochrome c biogenesis permease subunit